MAVYARLDTRTPQPLPSAWNGIALLGTEPDAYLAALGWYRVVESARPEPSDPIHNEMTEVLTRDGDTLIQSWTETRKAVVPTVADFAAARKAAIEADMRAAIGTVYSQGQQFDILARGVELADKAINDPTLSLTTEERAERDALRTAAAWYRAQLAERDRLFALIDGATGTDDEKRTAIAAITFSLVTP